MPPSNLENKPPENPVSASEASKLQSSEGEAQFLRTEAQKKVEESKSEGQPVALEQATSQVIQAYAKAAPEAVLVESRILSNPEFEKIVETVDALPHREKMRELYTVLIEKGILNALKVVGALNNPHIEEDFHHVIVQYVRLGKMVPGLDKERALAAELKRRVFELRVPLALEEGKVAPKQVRTTMERFLAGIFAQGVPSDAIYSFEIANANFATDLTFYAAVPDGQVDLFTKQFLGNFPSGQITEVSEDYNLFNEFGVSIFAQAQHEKRFAYALADPGELETLTTILGAFNQIQKEGEGAAIQYIVRMDDRGLLGKTRGAIGKIRDGESLSKATDIPLTFTGDAFKFVGKLFESEKTKEEPTPQEREKRDREVKVIEEKISAPFLRVDMRLVVSAGDKFRAEQIMNGLMSAFGQFTNRETSGGLRFSMVSGGATMGERLHAYTFREASDDALVLNHKELAALFHPPLAVTVTEAPNVAQVKASTAPPPGELPTDGTLLGFSTHRGERREVRMTKQDRLRHFYVIGQTGTGKTSILKNMIIEEIRAGNGATFIDPHGSDVQDILAAIPKERLDDVIYIDPTYTDRPFGLNMLEFDPTKPEQKIFVVNELLAIFKRLYASSPESMGPAFEQYFRNATMLVMESPEIGNTMIDIMRVLVDAEYRTKKLELCKNPIVTQFWRDMATKTTGEAGLQNMAPYIVNKFDVFISNDVMRPIIAQEKSSFNFREIMDQKKIFLVNLSKGKLGEMNANLIGLIIIGKFLLAAMSRVDAPLGSLPDHYLYVDEFQNVTTPSIAAILSEARKYGLSLNLAHQFLKQLPDDIKGAVFGNVGSMAIFRVGVEDASFFEEQLKPTFTGGDVQKIQNYNAYMKMLINGKPVPPFSIVTAPPTRGNPTIIEELKKLSYMKYGRDRETVDKEILARYASTSAAAQKKPAPVVAPAVRPSMGAAASASSAPYAPRPLSAYGAGTPAPMSQQAMPAGQLPPLSQYVPSRSMPQMPMAPMPGMSMYPAQNYGQGYAPMPPHPAYPQVAPPPVGMPPQMYTPTGPVAYPPQAQYPGHYAPMPPQGMPMPMYSPQPMYPAQYHPQAPAYYPPPQQMQPVPQAPVAPPASYPQAQAIPTPPPSQAPAASQVPSQAALGDQYREQF